MTQQVPLIIKLGGALLETEGALTSFIGGIQRFLQQFPRPLVLVHGGGCLVDDLLKALGKTSTKKNGLRVTPADQIPYVVGALAGTANKQMMAEAIAQGLNPVGLSLADGGLCDVTQLDPELGNVGDCKPKNPVLLQVLLAQNFLPVISSIGITAQGELMNVNADQAAIALAELLDADLIMLSDVVGILDANKQLIPELNTVKTEQLVVDGVITDGMAVKVKAALQVSAAIQKPIVVASWRDPDLLLKLAKGETTGTRIQA
jgi:acetylglutamate kinase